MSSFNKTACLDNCIRKKKIQSYCFYITTEINRVLRCAKPKTKFYFCKKKKSHFNNTITRNSSYNIYKKVCSRKCFSLCVIRQIFFYFILYCLKQNDAKLFRWKDMLCPVTTKIFLHRNSNLKNTINSYSTSINSQHVELAAGNFLATNSCLPSFRDLKFRFVEEGV